MIALTANAMAGEMERCLSLGFDAYLAKPVDQKKLRATLLTFARGRKNVEERVAS